MDALMLRALRRGSEGALGQIISKYTAYVCVIIRNAVGAALTHEDVEEVASDVFFALWECAGRCRHLKSYIGAIARNKAKNRLRQIAETLPLDENLPEGGVPLEERMIASDRQAAVKSAVLSMDSPDREIFLRHYYQGSTAAAIATETGLTEAAVKHRLIRGREKLRRTFEKEALL
jgi:RNA polymerase sigma-70 factor (ECF subfamily)